MPIYRVTVTRTIEYEVRGDRADTAIENALHDYSWTKEVLTKRESRARVKCEHLRIDPPCGVNDDGDSCPLPSESWNRTLDQWTCEKHAKMLQPGPDPLPVAEHSPAEEIPY